MKKIISLAGISVLAVGANAAFFDFEELPLSTTIRAFSETDSGVTASFLDPGADSWTQDRSADRPVWGSRSILFAIFTTNHQIVDFSSGQGLVLIEFSDFGSDNDMIHMRAWSGAGGTGALLDSDDVFWPASSGFPDAGVASVFSTTPIMSVELWEDGDTGANDIYWDNMTTRAIPEPATLIALGSLTVLALKRRKR